MSRAGWGHSHTGSPGYDSAPQEKWKFANYERDLGTGETGLDYAQFRHYSSGQGRFVQVDLMAGRQVTPQSLNRYSYVLNDPVNLLDPLGLSDGGGGSRCQSGYVWDGSMCVPLSGGGGGGGHIHSPLQDGGDGHGGGGGKKKGKHCNFNIRFSDKAKVGDDDAIKQRIQDVFNATADPNGNTVGVNFDFKGTPDGTFVISTGFGPKDQNGHEHIGQLVNGITPTIYAPSFVDGYFIGNLVTEMGTMGAHEIGHKFGLHDEPFDPAQNNANLMTVDSAADQGLNQQVWNDAANSTVQGFGQFTADQIGALFKKCDKMHP